MLDHGRTVAHGTPAELKTRIGTERIDVTIASPSDFDAVVRATATVRREPPTFDADRLVATVPIIEGTRLMEVMRALDAEGIDAVDLNRREATLDDVFLTLTDGVPAPTSPKTSRWKTSTERFPHATTTQP